jgi:hypothetical protein
VTIGEGKLRAGVKLQAEGEMAISLGISCPSQSQVQAQQAPTQMKPAIGVRLLLARQTQCLAAYQLGEAGPAGVREVRACLGCGAAMESVWQSLSRRIYFSPANTLPGVPEQRTRGRTPSASLKPILHPIFPPILESGAQDHPDRAYSQAERRGFESHHALCQIVSRFWVVFLGLQSLQAEQWEMFEAMSVVSSRVRAAGVISFDEALEVFHFPAEESRRFIDFSVVEVATANGFTLLSEEDVNEAPRSLPRSRSGYL